MNKGISILGRFLYLNIYAFLLLLIGLGIFVLPLYRHWLGLVFQIVWAIVCVGEAAKILSSWNDKKRKYVVLMERNTPVFRPDTCAEFMKAPCGRLLVRVVLKDLDQTHQYKELKKYERHLWQLSKDDCAPKKTVVYVNPNYNKV